MPTPKLDRTASGAARLALLLAAAAAMTGCGSDRAPSARPWCTGTLGWRQAGHPGAARGCGAGARAVPGRPGGSCRRCTAARCLRCRMPRLKMHRLLRRPWCNCVQR